MNRILLSLAPLPFSIITLAQDAGAPLWLRGSAISPDGQTIAFCCNGDIWRVPTSGGDAVPLTFNEAFDYASVWSHDGPPARAWRI